MRNDGHHINTTHLTAAQRHLSSREVGRGRSAGRWVGGGQATGLREAVWCLPPPTATLAGVLRDARLLRVVLIIIS